MAFVPGLSDRVDMLLDWAFVGICGEQGSVPASILCMLGILMSVTSIFVQLLDYCFLACTAPFASRLAPSTGHHHSIASTDFLDDLMMEFMALLVPTRKMNILSLLADQQNEYTIEDEHRAH